MVSVRLANVAIVVLSDGNNPRLVNPDFLARNGIVPEDWSAANVLVTPVLAQVQYGNGIHVTMEEKKVQFTATVPEQVDWAKVLTDMAAQFLRVLQHVAYRASGLNFTYISDEPEGREAEERLVKAMLVQDTWHSEYGGLTGVVLDLQYRARQPALNVKLGVRESVGPAGSRLGGYIIFGNFHHDFDPAASAARENFIRSLGDYETEFRRFMKTLPLHIS